MEKLFTKNNSLKHVTNNRKWELGLFGFALDKYIFGYRVNPCTVCGAMDAGINSPWRTVAVGEMYFVIFLWIIKFEPLQPICV
jgi:hypothetical protein